MNDHIKTARAAYEALLNTEAKVSDAKAKLSELERLERTEQIEREELRALEDEDEALRQLDGVDAVKPNEEHAARLAALDKSVPARAAAIRMQESRLSTAEAELRKAQNALAPPILHVVNEMQTNATEAIRAILGQLAPEFSTLIASDKIRISLIGDRFTVPQNCAVPIGGLHIVQTFLDALPDRLKSPELLEKSLFEPAHSVSSEIISHIKG